MAQQWHKTQHKGIRYREHPTKKHGRQPDRYFNVRFQVAGVSVNEGYGWASEGMSASKAALLVTELKKELRTGVGTGKLADRRRAREQAEADALEAEKAQGRKDITYENYFRSHYLPEANKSQRTMDKEISLHDLWIIPAMGKVLVCDVCELHLKKVLKRMGTPGLSERVKGGLSAQSKKHALAVLRIVMNHAIATGHFHGANPVSTLKKADKPKVANKRERFFTHQQADELLAGLLGKSVSVHNMTLVSLHLGLRAGEMYNLTWQYVDMDNRQLTLVDTKGGSDRTVRMTSEVFMMFESLPEAKGDQLVFPASNGSKRKWMSKTFDRVVDDLGLNTGITDRRKKLVFHSCRHTCASWLIQSGVPLYQVKEIMGHSSIGLTERYAHLAPDGQIAAMAAMEQAIQASRGVTNDKVMSIG